MNKITPELIKAMAEASAIFIDSSNTEYRINYCDDEGFVCEAVNDGLCNEVVFYYSEVADSHQWTFKKLELITLNPNDFI